MTPQSLDELGHALQLEIPLVAFMAENDFFSRSDLKRAGVTAQDVAEFAVKLYEDMRRFTFPPGCERGRDRLCTFIADLFGEDLDDWARAAVIKAREEREAESAT